MDMKLEKLKNNVMDLCGKIENSSLNVEDIQNELFNLTGEIDEIRDHYDSLKTMVTNMF